MDFPLVRAIALLAVAGSLAACGNARTGPDPATGVTVEDLKIGPEAYPALERVDVSASVVDRDPEDADAPGMILTLRDLGIRSSANYKLWLRAEPHPLIVKARVNVFASAARAAEDFAQRYGADARALSTPLDLGDEAFYLQDRLVVMRVAHVSLELSLQGAPARLIEAATAYERFVRARLARGG